MSVKMISMLQEEKGIYIAFSFQSIFFIIMHFFKY